MKKIFKYMTIAPLLLLATVGCGEGSSSSASSSVLVSSSIDKYQEREIEVKDVIAKVNIEGRYEVLEEGVSCDWSASALEFKADVYGKVILNISSKEARKDNSAEGKMGLTLFSIYVDGVRVKKNIALDNETKDIEVYNSSSAGIHVFKVVRQTNVYMANASFNKIKLKGNLLEVEKKTRKIEFIGDSYTTGYSLQGVKEGGGYDSSFDDPLDAYAYQAAERLNANYNLTAFSGAGFAYGYTSFTVPYAYNFHNYFRSEISYSPDDIPDLIVVNLGTNDVAQVGFSANHQAIKNGVKKLINATYNAYGVYAPLIFCTDKTHENNDSVIKEAMDELLKDVPYTFVTLTTNNKVNNYHPDATCGHIQGEELATFIKSYLPDIF